MAGQNLSNTILITNQPEDEICNLRSFISRLVFVPKFFDNGNLPCYETTQRVDPIAEQPFYAHFLNNKGPVTETAEDNLGMNIFWRRGMMDTCVQAVKWTLDDKTVRIEKNPSISKDQDRIFIPAKCEAQEVTLTYISNESSFEINNHTVKFSVQAFTDKCLQVPEEGEEELKADDSQLKITIAWTVAGAMSFALLTVLVSICLFVRHKRRNMVKIDYNE